MGIDVEIEEIMEMRLRRHAKGDGPWEEEQDFQLPDASGGSSFRREAQSVKSTSQGSLIWVVLRQSLSKVFVESILLFILMSMLIALILNLDINYGCGTCSKSQETSFSIYNAIYSENKKGKNSASVTLPLGDALQTFHVILTSPHSAVSVTLIFLSKLVYNEGF